MGKYLYQADNSQLSEQNSTHRCCSSAFIAYFELEQVFTNRDMEQWVLLILKIVLKFLVRQVFHSWSLWSF